MEANIQEATFLCIKHICDRDKMAAILADDIFNYIPFIENAWILNEISLKYVPYGPIDNIVSDNGLAPNRRQAIIWSNDG